MVTGIKIRYNKLLYSGGIGVQGSVWCEHEKMSRYTLVEYKTAEKTVLLRVQTWLGPECGTHGADTEIIGTVDGERQKAVAG